MGLCPHPPSAVLQPLCAHHCRQQCGARPTAGGGFWFFISGASASFSPTQRPPCAGLEPPGAWSCPLAAPFHRLWHLGGVDTPPYVINTVRYNYNSEIQFLIPLGGSNQVPTSPPKFLLRGLFSDNAFFMTSKVLSRPTQNAPAHLYPQRCRPPTSQTRWGIIITPRSNF